MYDECVKIAGAPKKCSSVLDAMRADLPSRLCKRWRIWTLPRR
jgi:hypothetical protein